MKIWGTWLNSLRSGAGGFWIVCSTEIQCLSKQERQRLILSLRGEGRRPLTPCYLRTSTFDTNW